MKGIFSYNNINLLTFRYLIYLVSYFIILIFAFYLFKYHLNLIFFPFQHEYREGAPLLLASEFLKGNLPYTFKNQPYLSDVFGFMYSFLSIPFLKIFGVKLASMRIFSGICILISTIYFAYNQVKYKVSFFQIIAFSIIFYSVNLFLCIPIARPDSLGFLFFILCLYIPVQKNFSNSSLVLSLLFCIFSYFTKSYFVIGFPIVLTYVFLIISKKTAINFMGIFLLSFLFCQVIIHLIFDFYFIGTFSTQLASTEYDFGHLITQLHFYFFKLLFFPAFLLIYYFIKYILLIRNNIILSFEKTGTLLNYLQFKSLELPLLKNINLNVNFFYFIVCLSLILFKLGGHPGQFGVYLIHFLTFPLLILISVRLSRYNHVYQLILILIFLFISVKNIFNILPLGANFSENKSILKLKQDFKQNKDVLSTPLFASILVENSKKVYASGLTEYFFYVPQLKENYGIPKPIAKLKDKLFLNLFNKSIQKRDSYMKNISTKVERRLFDVILLDNSIYDDWFIDKKLLMQNYVLIESFTVRMQPCYQKYKVFKYIPKNYLN